MPLLTHHTKVFPSQDGMIRVFLTINSFHRISRINSDSSKPPSFQSSPAQSSYRSWSTRSSQPLYAPSYLPLRLARPLGDIIIWSHIIISACMIHMPLKSYSQRIWHHSLAHSHHALVTGSITWVLAVWHHQTLFHLPYSRIFNLADAHLRKKIKFTISKNFVMWIS